MNWAREYLYQPIKNRKPSLKGIKRGIQKVVCILPHAFLAHEAPKSPLKELPDITDESEHTIALSKELYDDSFERIESIEKKAFNLLALNSALFAFFSFLYIQSSFLALIRFVVFLALVLLSLAILVIFRCMHIKTIRALFINTIFNFDNDDTSLLTDKKKVIKDRLECAIYNQTIADNTVDILSAARYLIGTALFLVLFCLLVYGINVEPQKADKTNSDKISFDILRKSEEFQLIEKRLNIAELKLDKISQEYQYYITKSDSIKPNTIKQDSVSIRE